MKVRNSMVDFMYKEIESHDQGLVQSEQKSHPKIQVGKTKRQLLRTGTKRA